MTKKISLITFILILMVIIITMAYYIFQLNKGQKISSNTIGELNSQVNILKNTIEKYKEENTILSSQKPSSNLNVIVNETVPSSANTTSNEDVKYEFTSADNLAAEGNPGILKIFNLTDSQMIFEYNHAWDFTQYTIDRKISATANIIDENLYEFIEYIDGHTYSITIKFDEEMVTLCEYSDGSLISQINLWA